MNWNEVLRTGGRLLMGVSVADGVARRNVQAWHLIGLGLWLLAEMGLPE